MASSSISGFTSTHSLLATNPNHEKLNALQNISEAIGSGCDKILEAISLKLTKKVMHLDEKGKKKLSKRLIQLIINLCTPTIPVKILDIENRIQAGLPCVSVQLIPDKAKLEELKSIADRGKKKQLLLPSDKIFSILKDVYAQFDPVVSLYIVAVLDHLITSLLTLAVNYESKIQSTVKDSEQNVIHKTKLKTLLTIYWNEDAPVVKAPRLLGEFVSQFPKDYLDCTKELHYFLCNCIEQTTLIIRLFKDPLQQFLPNSAEVVTVFGNIVDINFNLRILADAIDDVFESSEERLMGSSFYDPAEDDIFDDFVTYGNTIFAPSCVETMTALMEKEKVVAKLVEFSETVRKATHKRSTEPDKFWVHNCTDNCPGRDSMGCNYMINCFRYLLPRLLILPILHLFASIEFIRKLEACSVEEDDSATLKEVLSILIKTRRPLERKVNDNVSILEMPRFNYFLRTQQSFKTIATIVKKKVEEIDAMVKNGQDSWEKPTGQCEFILEDTLMVGYDNKKLSERYIYLFSTWMLVCKRPERRINLGQASHGSSQLKVKKKINLDQFNLIDIGLNDDKDSPRRLIFEIEYIEQKNDVTTTQKMTFTAKSNVQKVDWMATLLTLQTNRLFNKYMRELPKEEIPLQLPSPEKYIFAIPDSPYNIQFEESTTENSADIPVIRAATLPKLVERITFHNYFDSKTLSSFLLVFRNFTTPRELLDLLIERFKIPDPDFENDDMSGSISRANEHMLKRFRTTYKKRVQLRVLNVLINWIRNPEYYQTDFQNNEDLKMVLSSFLDEVEGRHLKAGKNKIQKHLLHSTTEIQHTFDHAPHPIIRSKLFSSWDAIKLTNIHPLEFARQVTLYEWELYRKIKYWEVSGSELTTSADAPNLFKSQEFSNKFKCWMVYSVMSQNCIEDRMVMMQRICDLMMIFESLNNMQGAQEAKGALISAAVFRLYHTHALINQKSRIYRNHLEHIRKQCNDPNDMYTVEYQRKIRNINPPCVPFIAFGGKTQLIHYKIANQDLVTLDDGTQLINFKKHRLSSEVVEHYLSFQRTPYNFYLEPVTREFLEKLDPYKLAAVSDEHAFDDYAFNRSKDLEPKDVQLQDLASYESVLTNDEAKLAIELGNMPLEEKLLNEPTTSSYFTTKNPDDKDNPSPPVPPSPLPLRTTKKRQTSITTSEAHLNHSSSSIANSSSSIAYSSSPTFVNVGGHFDAAPSHHKGLQFDAAPSHQKGLQFDAAPSHQKQTSAGLCSPGPPSLRHGTSPPSTSSTPIVPCHQYSMSDSVVCLSPRQSHSTTDHRPPLPPRARDPSTSTTGTESDSGGTIPPPRPPRRTQTSISTSPGYSAIIPFHITPSLPPKPSRTVARSPPPPHASTAPPAVPPRPAKRT